MDQNDDKNRTTERHLRGAKRFEERKENLQKRKKRGHAPPSRMGNFGEDGEYDDGAFEDASVGRSVKRPQSDRGANQAKGMCARVSQIARTEIRVLTEDGEERTARVTPRVHAQGGLVVGDEVRLDDFDRVVQREDRRTLLERRAPGQQHRTRLLAANVDVGLVVLAPREDGLSLGFLDRAIAALQRGGIEPCVVVTKVDLCADNASHDALRATLEPWTASGIDVHLVGSPTGEGIDELRDSLAGRVAVLLGHSGVGKSTLVNALDPDAGQATGAVREGDGKGRHTTTSSRLVPFLAGGALVDTPGVRQLVPDVTDVDALARAIPELTPYLGQCRFTDCAHVGEPGCAVAVAAEGDDGVAGALRRLQRLIASSGDD